MQKGQGSNIMVKKSDRKSDVPAQYLKESSLLETVEEIP